MSMMMAFIVIIIVFLERFTFFVDVTVCFDCVSTFFYSRLIACISLSLSLSRSLSLCLSHTLTLSLSLPRYYKFSDAERRHAIQPRLGKLDSDAYRDLVQQRSTAMIDAEALRATTTVDGVANLHAAVRGRLERETGDQLALERRMKHERARRRRSHLQRLINRLEAKAVLSGPALFLRGSWSHRRAMRGAAGGGRLGEAFDTALDRRQLVLVVDEKFTSKRCCFCGRDVRQAKASDVGVDSVFEKGSRWCVLVVVVIVDRLFSRCTTLYFCSRLFTCDHCTRGGRHPLVNRDVCAGISIVGIALRALLRGTRDPVFCRRDEGVDQPSPPSSSDGALGGAFRRITRSAARTMRA
jgi:hypothetical protein